jgi:hypothetical protein
MMKSPTPTREPGCTVHAIPVWSAQAHSRGPPGTQLQQ